MNVAEEFDTRFDSPIILELIHQWVSEEEARLIPTHMSVADRVTVDDFPLRHIFTDFPGLFLIDPSGKRPMFVRNLSIVCLSRNQGRGDFLERLIKWFVIQEHPSIIIISVKTILNLAYRPSDFPNISVAC